MTKKIKANEVHLNETCLSGLPRLCFDKKAAALENVDEDDDRTMRDAIGFSTYIKDSYAVLYDDNSVTRWFLSVFVL